MDTTGEFQYNAEAQEKPRLSVLDCSAKAISNFRIGISRFISHWKIIVAGQVLSLLLAVSGAMSASMHIDCNLSSPAAQTALVYFLMSWHIRCKGIGTGIDPESWISGPSSYSRSETTASGIRTILNLMKKDAKAISNRDNTVNGDAQAVSNELSVDNQCHRNHHKELSLDLHPPIFRSIHIPFCVPIWAYALLALIHVEANYFTYLAFRYTAMTSVSLLDNLNIFSAMLCSKIILRRHYRASHIFGALICLAGVGLNLFIDYQRIEENPDQMDDVNDEEEAKEYPRRLMGDSFAIIGGLLVGILDVLIEMLVKNFGGNNEYIGMVGVFGFVISILQAGIFERHDVAKFVNDDNIDMDVADEYQNYNDPYDAPRTCSRSRGLFFISIYILSSYLFNVGITHFLNVSESAFLTLSLLTGDLWAVSFTIIAEHVAPRLLFYIALIIIFVGVVIYEMAPSPLEDDGREGKSMDQKNLNGEDNVNNEISFGRTIL